MLMLAGCSLGAFPLAGTIRNSQPVVISKGYAKASDAAAYGSASSMAATGGAKASDA